MKALLRLALVAIASSSTTNVDPVNKVVSMISKLQGEIIKEGAGEQEMYNEFAHMCQSRSHELHLEAKTSKANVVEASANIEKSSADITLLQEKISDAAAAIDDCDSEVKKAADIRNKEAADYKAEEKSIVTMISSLERAITISEKGNDSGASLAQVQQDRMQSIATVFGAMVEASAFDSYDQEKLSALVQTSDTQESSDGEEGMGAPSAAAYKGQSGGVIEVLGGLLEKAQKGLEDARQGETKSLHSFEMQRQSLNDKSKTMNKELGEAKKDLAQSGERKATEEGNLDASKKDLAETNRELEELHHECLDKANSFEESAASRNEELKALAEAKKIISGSSGGAAKQTYDLAQQASFVQVASQTESSSSESIRALHVVRHLAFSHQSQALTQLANSVEQVIRVGSASGVNPFGKVKVMLESMINKLEEQAEASATKQGYCDKAMSETSASKEDKEDDIEKLAIQIDVLSASSKKLKSDVMRLDKELGELAGVQAEMDKLRLEEKALYNENKPIMEQGLEGIKTALSVLRDYYAQDEGAGADGAGGGIIGMLEVVESDFSKGMAGMTAEEDSAQSEYVAATQENKLARATKEGDAKGKTAEYLSLDKAVVDLKSDETGSQDQLAAVQEYFTSVKKDCVTKVDSYAERKTRRDEEIAGLKEAMETLKQEPSFLQQDMVQKTLRGATVRLHKQ